MEIGEGMPCSGYCLKLMNCGPIPLEQIIHYTLKKKKRNGEHHRKDSGGSMDVFCLENNNHASLYKAKGSDRGFMGNNYPC